MSLLLNNNVGYTVIGNPTITDGVITPTSSSDVVKTSQSFSFGNSGKYEFNLRFKVPNSGSLHSILGTDNIWERPFFLIDGSNILFQVPSGSNMYPGFGNISTDTWYRSKVVGDTGIWAIWLYDDSGTLINSGTYDDSASSNVVTCTSLLFANYYGTGNAGVYLDLNNTYIKVNNITWFNGKQTASTSIQDIKFNNNIGYTVVGTPTISDGIASNFSNGNYIKLQSNIPIITSFEENIRFKIIQDCAGKSLLSYSTTYNSNNLEGNINISNNLDSINVSLFIKYDGTYEEYSIQYNFSQHLNKYFTFKVYTDLSNVYLYLYDENNILVGTNTYTNINLVGIIDDNKILIGNIYDESDYWPSEIDLNNTYIKFNGVTWFNGKQTASTDLNYVMQNNGSAGYEIVGNPTITDGIVSGFSSNSFLQTTTNLTLNDNKVEIFIKINAGDYSDTTSFFMGGGIKLYKNWQNTLEMMFTDTTQSVQYIGGITTIQKSTDYYLYLIYKPNDISLYSSTDGETFITEIEHINYTINNSSPLILGNYYNGYSGYWVGSIDLNKTYVKINNKYWFNGGSKLIWCDPNIYLQGDGNQLIVTDIYPNSNYTLEANIKPIYNSTQYNNSIIDTAGNGDEKGRIGFLYRDEDLSSEAAGCIFYNYYPTTISSWTNYQFNKKYNLKTIKDSENTYFYVNGNLDNTRALETLETSTQPLKFWNDNSKGILYNVKVNDDNGNLVGNFVPVPQGMVVGGGYLAPSNGMFDIVKQKFYPNSGTGTFNIGKD